MLIGQLHHSDVGKRDMSRRTDGSKLKGVRAGGISKLPSFASVTIYDIGN